MSIVAHGDAVAVAPGDRGDAGPLGDVLEGAVALLRKRRSPPSPAWAGSGAKRPPLDAIDVEPAVAVVVEQADAAGHGLGELAERGLAVVEGEAQAGGLGVVGEGGRVGPAGASRGALGRGGPPDDLSLGLPPQV